jgi:hypothetical protein
LETKVETGVRPDPASEPVTQLDQLGFRKADMQTGTLPCTSSISGKVQFARRGLVAWVGLQVTELVGALDIGQHGILLRMGATQPLERKIGLA